MTSSPDKQVRPRNKFRELFRDRVLADVPGGGGGTPLIKLSGRVYLKKTLIECIPPQPLISLICEFHDTFGNISLLNKYYKQNVTRLQLAGYSLNKITKDKIQYLQ
jgi:hypothetical protein